MAKKKRTPDNVIQDRALISDLMLKGYTNAEIQEVMKDKTGRELSVAQVGFAKKQIRDGWFKKQTINYTALLAQELDRLDSLENELWAKLRESSEPRIRRTIDKYQKASSLSKTEDLKTLLLDEDKAARVSETTETPRVDPRFFDLIIKVQQERRKLLGLYAPEHKTVSHDVAIKGYTTVSPSDWDTKHDPVVIEGVYES